MRTETLSVDPDSAPLLPDEIRDAHDRVPGVRDRVRQAVPRLQLVVVAVEPEPVCALRAEVVQVREQLVDQCDHQEEQGTEPGMRRSVHLSIGLRLSTKRDSCGGQEADAISIGRIRPRGIPLPGYAACGRAPGVVF